MDVTSLYVSNFSTEIVVPLDNVAEVTYNRLGDEDIVTIWFGRDTEFGGKVIFAPKMRFFRFRRSHPVVEEIRRAVRHATGAGEGQAGQPGAPSQAVG